MQSVAEAEEQTQVRRQPVKARLCEALPDICEADFWDGLQKEARSVAEREPELRALLDDVIFSQPDFRHALAARLARKLAREDMKFDHLAPLLSSVISEGEHIACAARADLIAINERDAACHSVLTPLLYFKGFLALSTYRVSHRLWSQGREQLALYFQSLGSEVFGVDIHPAARIGCGIMLDHATSFVVGETAIVEDEVSILHEVTLGGTGKEEGDRHPIVRSHVLIGAGAKILGRVEIGQSAKIGAGSVVLADVPPHVTVAGVPAVAVGQSREANPAEQMDQTLRCGDFNLIGKNRVDGGRTLVEIDESLSSSML